MFAGSCFFGSISILRTTNQRKMICLPSLCGGLSRTRIRETYPNLCVSSLNTHWIPFTFEISCYLANRQTVGITCTSCKPPSTTFMVFDFPPPHTTSRHFMSKGFWRELRGSDRLGGYPPQLS